MNTLPFFSNGFPLPHTAASFHSSQTPLSFLLPKFADDDLFPKGLPFFNKYPTPLPK